MLAPTAGAAPLEISVNGSRVPTNAASLTVDAPLIEMTALSASGERDLSPHGGTTAQQLLRDVGVGAASVRSMAVSISGRPGPAVDLSPAEITDGFSGDPARCDPCFATFDARYNNGATVKFFRPQRSAGDVNEPDYLTPAYGQALSVAITTDGRQRIVLGATASDLTPDAGEPVTFNVVTAGLPAGTKLTWDLGDGSPFSRETGPTRSFRNGRYEVAVAAVAPDGSSGFESLTVQVGPVESGVAQSPVPTDAGAPAGGGSGGNGSGAGSNADGGGTGRDTSTSGGTKESTTAGQGPAAQATTPSARSTTRQRAPRTNDRRAAAEGAQDVPSSSAATDPAAVQTAEPSAPSAGSDAAKPVPQRNTVRPGGREDRVRPKRDSATWPRPGSGKSVRGEVLNGPGGDVATALAAADALARKPADPRPAARGGAGSGSSWTGWATGSTVIVVLLGLGTARELRRLPTPMPLP